MYSNLSQRIKNLRRYSRMKLDAKIRHTRRLIERGLEQAERPILAWSGGKDSTILLHLVRQYVPDIIVEFNNTGVEFPETVQFVRQMHQEWDLNLHVAKPEKGKDFWWCVETLGWPLLGKDFRRKTKAEYLDSRQRKVMDAKIPISASCCWYLKEKPALNLQRELDADLVFLGTMASESMRRRLTWAKHGDFRWNKKEKIWKVLPLSIWTDDDVWEYHRRHDLPMCKLYSMGHDRNGCWPCAMDIAFDDNHLAALRQSHPKLWRFLIVDKGLGWVLIKLKLALSDGQANMFADTWGIEALLEQRPCFFDKL